MRKIRYCIICGSKFEPLSTRNICCEKQECKDEINFFIEHSYISSMQIVIPLK